MLHGAVLHGAVLHGAVLGAEPLLWITPPRGGSVAPGPACPLAPDMGWVAAAARENSPHFGSLSHELQLLAARLGSLSHRGCQGECTNIRHNELEESFASVFWSHCHNKSGYTTWARDLCVANSK